MNKFSLKYIFERFTKLFIIYILFMTILLISAFIVSTKEKSKERIYTTNNYSEEIKDSTRAPEMPGGTSPKEHLNNTLDTISDNKDEYIDSAKDVGSKVIVETEEIIKSETTQDILTNVQEKGKHIFDIIKSKSSDFVEYLKE